MSTAPPHHRPATSSPRYPSDTVTNLLGSDRPSIVTFIATVNKTFSHCQRRHRDVRNGIEVILRLFDKEEFWCLLQKDQRQDLLRIVGKDEKRVQEAIATAPPERGITDLVLSKEMNSARMLFQKFGLGSVNGSKQNRSPFRPKQLQSLLSRVQTEVFPHDVHWSRAEEDVFTRTVLMDLYPPEAQLLHHVLQEMLDSPQLKSLQPQPAELLRYVLDRAGGNENAQSDFASYLAVKHHRLVDGAPDPHHLKLLTDNDFSRSPYFDLEEQSKHGRSKGEDRNAAALDPFRTSDPRLPFPFDEHNEYSLTHRTFLHQHRNFLGVLTPRQAQRYGRPAADGVWA